MKSSFHKRSVSEYSIDVQCPKCGSYSKQKMSRSFVRCPNCGKEFKVFERNNDDDKKVEEVSRFVPDYSKPFKYPDDVDVAKDYLFTWKEKYSGLSGKEIIKKANTFFNEFEQDEEEMLTVLSRLGVEPWWKQYKESKVNDKFKVILEADMNELRSSIDSLKSSDVSVLPSDAQENIQRWMDIAEKAFNYQSALKDLETKKDEFAVNILEPLRSLTKGIVRMNSSLLNLIVQHKTIVSPRLKELYEYLLPSLIDELKSTLDSLQQDQENYKTRAYKELGEVPSAEFSGDGKKGEEVEGGTTESINIKPVREGLFDWLRGIIHSLTIKIKGWIALVDRFESVMSEVLEKLEVNSMVKEILSGKEPEELIVSSR